ncbi:MoaD/ThiS family protein [Candidatus Chloroploca sp. M-50]|uniref:Molybdopterin synthase sulfur carrier subunit n=2 Tax=Candidatus Chloroploca TaxID=1579476 RepID=A0A2H3KMB3_9CHLR|nr:MULTISPECIES: ubiquitin-like small modifier protein 1 [Candidatus Chloroploca]MBP1464124.1 MoaD/ThiS family protein [Candidatus Chloroploca mongolica]PDV98471.1 molybdopterin synthase sulfur carrier subunit [Candidatus Chloroploca asiatica]
MKINFYATLRPIVGGRTVELPLEEGVTVRELVTSLVEQWPPLREQLLDEHGELYQHVHVFINGRDAPYRDGGMEATITAEDVIDVFPAVAGG